MSGLAVPERNDILPGDTWNGPGLFASDAIWEDEYRDVESKLPLLSSGKERMHAGPGELLDVLQEIEDTESRTMKLMVYAVMSYSVDTRNQSAASMYDTIQNLLGNVSGAAAFLGPELLAIGRETLDEWMKKEPKLAVYRHYIENLFRNSTHMRSGEVEEVLGMLAGPFGSAGNVFSLMTNADFTFKPAVGSDRSEIPVTQSSFDAVLHGTDREARRTAWEHYMDMYLSHKNTLAGTLGTSVKQNVFDMHVRGHEGTLEAALFENNIPTNVFHNLIDVFTTNLPTWHRYWRLRRKALGVDVLHPYDIWAPLTDSKPRMTYHQAVDIIVEGTAPLGNDYTAILKQGCLTGRWVDYRPNTGKTAGAFSTGSKGTSPFICMSFTDDVESLSTLAHELGHSMHSYLTWQNQPFIYSDYSLFVAEVASNFHQAMVRAHLLKTRNDPAFQIAVLEEAMSNFHRYFFIMPTLARFEYEVHQRVERGEGITADSLIDLMADLFTEGYGGEMHVDRNRVGMTWSTFGHLYEDYYVFQYATGISAAHALSNRILDGVPGAVENYLSFLKAGGSVYPLDALKIAGVDLTTTKAVEETFTILGGYVDRLEKLLSK